MNTKPKTRASVVDECAGVVAACYAHYADEPLTAKQLKRIKQQLDKLFPSEVVMARYDAQRAAYELEHAEGIREKNAIHAATNPA